jgi:DNA mismatch repair protein MutS
VAASAPPRPAKRESEVERRLKAVHPDELTPKEALSLIYELAEIAKAAP